MVFNVLTVQAIVKNVQRVNNTPYLKSEEFVQSMSGRTKPMNPCGENSTCDCSQQHSGTVSLLKCQSIGDGHFLIAKIRATIISVEKMYEFHSNNNTKTISLTILNMDIEQILNFDKNLLGINWLSLLIFENKVKIGLQ